MDLIEILEVADSNKGVHVYYRYKIGSLPWQKNRLELEHFEGFLQEFLDGSEKNGRETFVVGKEKLPKKLGRPSLGVTKKVSITLPFDFWAKIDSTDKKRSEIFRELVYNYLDGYLDMNGYDYDFTKDD